MTLPTLRQLEYAVTVADHGHFGRAAEAAAVSQPGLSGQIRELERRLGVTLFERGRTVSLTPAGRDVVERSRRLLRDAHELTMAAAAHQGTVRGLLRLAAIPTMAPYLLPAAAAVLREEWPDARLSIQELQTEAMVAAIDNGDVDLGLLAIPFDTGPLHLEPLGHEPFHLALPEGHPLAGKKPLPIAALAGLQMLLLPEGHCLRDHAQQACDIAGRVEHSDVHAASLATLAQMVAGGVGVTLLPASAVSIEARPGTGITTRPFEPPAPGRTIALAWRTSDPRASLYANVIDPLQIRLHPLTT